MTDRLFRHSQTVTFQESRRLYKIKYIDNLERDYGDGPRKVQAFDVGNIMHRGMAAVFKGHSDSFARKYMESYVRRENLYDHEKMSVHEGYTAFERNVAAIREQGKYQGYEVVAVEKRLRIDMGIILGDHVVLTGEPDLVLRDNFKCLAIIDWKAVASYGAIESYVAENTQGFNYALMLEQEHGVLPTSFTLHTVLRKPLKTKAFEPFQRATTYLDPEVLERHKRGLRRKLEHMVRLHQECEAGDDSGAYTYPKWTCDNMCGMKEICCQAISKGERELAETIRVNFRQRKTEL